jgi:serine/threonine protein kinase, bacterial
MPMADGSSFAGYTIIGCLGSGGMGEVYVAQHPRLPRQDALKVLRTEISADREYRERFLREADLVATLSHPHIVGVYDRGDERGQLWITMDYVHGLDAGQLLNRQPGQTLPADQVVEIVAAVAAALDYAHQRNLLHRDVKPANILIGGTGLDDRRIKLADFGIARKVDESNGLTATNMTIGTVSYAAPEQLTGGAIDGRGDQYALAATAFHLLSGAPPFSDSNPAVVIGQHLSVPPPALSTRRPELAALDPVLAKALAKDPNDRFEKCADFARALQHQLGLAGPEATTLATTASGEPTAQSTAVMPTGGRSRSVLVVPVVLALLLAAAITFAVLEFHRAKDERPAPSTPVTDTVTESATPSPSPSPTVTTGQMATVAPPIETTPAAPTSSTVPVTTESTPEDPESPIRECMQQTGKTRLQCWEDVRRARRRG